MNKIIQKIFFLIFVFVLAGTAFFFFNRPKTKDTVYVSMEAATLPVISMRSGEFTMNTLRGYTQPMELVSMRDSITPLNQDRTVTCRIQTYGNHISSVQYEIRSLDGTQLLEKTEVEAAASEEGVVEAVFPIQNLIAQDEEYMMLIQLVNDSGREIYYYTRILWSGNTYVPEFIHFAQDFSNKSFDSEASRELVTYLETDNNADNSSLGRVNIRSSFNQITWAGLPLIRENEPEVTIKELGGGLADLCLTYQVVLDQGEGQREVYDVREAFSLKWTSQRIYLMAYQRTMDQIFEASNTTISTKKIMLGISQGDSLESMFSSDNKHLAFVSNKELWGYDIAEHSAIRIFTFRDGSGDSRVNYGQYDIKLVSANDNGDVDFMVYGYMNRGDHEGEVGISYYHYNAAETLLEEKFYIPSIQSYEMLRADIGTLAFVNSEQLFYFMFQGSIYAIDLSGREFVIVVENLNSDEFAVSADSQRIAWIQKNLSTGKNEIQFMNLETGEKQTVYPEEGQQLKILGFVDDDFIYGMARDEDLSRGEGKFLMYAFSIVGDGLVLHQKYEEPGSYITAVRVEGTRIYINRAAFDESGRVVDLEETMLRRTEEITTRTGMGVSREKTEAKRAVYYIGIESNREAEKAIEISAPEKIWKPEADNRIQLPAGRKGVDQFYVYCYGSYSGVYANFVDAVQAAYDDMGTVTGPNQQIVWARTRKKVSASVTPDPRIAYQPELSGTEILAQAYPELAVLNAEGSTLNQALNFTSNGKQLLAIADPAHIYLVVGYDQFNVNLLNLADGATTKMGLNDAGNYFQNTGNRFYTYMD